MPPTSLPSLVSVCPRSKVVNAFALYACQSERPAVRIRSGALLCCLLHPDSQITLESSSESEASRGGNDYIGGVAWRAPGHTISTSYNSERQALVESALVNRGHWETQDVETRAHYFYRTAVFEKDFPTRIGTIAGGQKQSKRSSRPR